MKYFLSLIFVVLLLIPSLSWLSGFDYIIFENRTRSGPPKISGRALLDQQFYRRFDSYFNDNFNMRGVFIFTKNWLDYYAWRTLPSYKLFLGRNGWIYERRSIRDYVKEACNEESAVGQTFLQLHALENIIASSGRTFLFTIPPNKSTIYPEHVGVFPKYNNCGKSRYDFFLEKQSMHPIKGFVRLDDILLDKKKSALLYYKTDSHWNEYAALIVSSSILKKLFNQRWKSQLPLFEFVEVDRFEGMAFDIMGLLFAEKAPHIKTLSTPSIVYKGKGALVSSSDDSYDKNRRADITFRPKNYVWHFLSIKDSASEDLPSAILYSDSYAISLIQFIVYSFKNLDLYRTFDIPSEEGIEDLKSYDIIMLEVAERLMRHLKIDLNRILSDLENEMTNIITSEVELSTVIPNSDIELEVVDDGLHIKSNGEAPLLSFSTVPASSDKSFRILKLSIGSPQSAHLNIFYGHNGQVNYNQPNQNIMISEGLHDVYIPLPFEKEYTLFLSCGSQLSSYRLSSAEILEFSGL